MPNHAFFSSFFSSFITSPLSPSPPRFLHVLPCSLPCRILSTRRRPPQTHTTMTQSIDFPCLSLSGARTPGSNIQGHRHFSPTVGHCVGGGEGIGKRKCGTLCWSLSQRPEFVIRIQHSPLSLEPVCLCHECKININFS